MTMQGVPSWTDAGVVRDDTATDRRAADRVTTIYRPVIIEVGDFTGFCLVRNISAGGLLGVVYAEFMQGLPLTIEFSPRIRIEGKIIWSAENRIGVRFREEIDVLAVLHELGQKMINDQVNRPPRLQFECPIRVEHADRSHPATMHNISQRGLRMSGVALAVGDEPVIHLPDMEPRKAIVRWTDRDVAGVNFLRPLEFEALAGWVIDFHSR